MDITAELTELGTQLQQALVSAYQAKAGAATVLAFRPDVAVPGTLVQGNQVNPLQVTTWLELVADEPLLVRTDQAAVVGGAPGSLDHMTEIYRDLVQFATPTANAGTPEALRVTEEIASAQADAGGDLPLNTSPSDWPLPNLSYWTHFSYSQSESTGPAGPGSEPPSRTPGIWALREVPPIDVPPPVRVDVPPTRIEVPPTRIEQAPARIEEPLARVIDDPVMFHFPVDQVEPPPPPVATLVTRLDLYHMLVLIDRSLWWHNDVVQDPGWYVAGLPRGAWVGVPPADGTAYALPVALLLVQNLTLTGSWSSEETTALTAPGMMLGPFNLGGGLVSSASDGSVSISVPGMRLAGLFCQPLPVLPPADPPASS